MFEILHTFILYRPRACTRCGSIVWGTTIVGRRCSSAIATPTFCRRTAPPSCFASLCRRWRRRRCSTGSKRDTRWSRSLSYRPLPRVCRHMFSSGFSAGAGASCCFANMVTRSLFVYEKHAFNFCHTLRPWCVWHGCYVALNWYFIFFLHLTVKRGVDWRGVSGTQIHKIEPKHCLWAANAGFRDQDNFDLGYQTGFVGLNFQVHGFSTEKLFSKVTRTRTQSLYKTCCIPVLLVSYGMHHYFRHLEVWLQAWCSARFCVLYDQQMRRFPEHDIQSHLSISSVLLMFCY